MRGASALAQLLREHPSPSLRLFVVWEPVLPSDRAPPAPALVSQLADARAELFWDPSRLVSRAIEARGEHDPGFDVWRDGTIWDTELVFARGALWQAQFPPHTHAGSNVIDDVPVIGKELP
ncbi:MAG TPA: hypothetical protein VFF06_14815 [Polyangia bacterium]|nr:hypothetical protein [Polyangia bacterium]